MNSTAEVVHKYVKKLRGDRRDVLDPNVIKPYKMTRPVSL